MVQDCNKETPRMYNYMYSVDFAFNEPGCKKPCLIRGIHLREMVTILFYHSLEICWQNSTALERQDHVHCTSRRISQIAFENASLIWALSMLCYVMLNDLSRPFNLVLPFFVLNPSTFSVLFMVWYLMPRIHSPNVVLIIWCLYESKLSEQKFYLDCEMSFIAGQRGIMGAKKDV